MGPSLEANNRAVANNDKTVEEASPSLANVSAETAVYTPNLKDLILPPRPEMDLAPQSELTQIQVDRVKLMQQIAELKGQGFAIKVESGVTTGPNTGRYGRILVNACESDLYSNLAYSPNDHLQAEAWHLQEVDPSIQKYDSTATIYPYSLVTENLANGDEAIRIYDVLSKDSPLVFSTTRTDQNITDFVKFDESGEPQFLKSQELDRQLRGRAEKHQSVVQSIKPAENADSKPKAVFPIDGREIPETSRNNLQKALENNKITFEVTPNGYEADYGFRFGGGRISLSKEYLGQNSVAPIMIDGNLELITFTSLEDYNPSDTASLTSHGSFKSSRSYDKYGNQIIESYRKSKDHEPGVRIKTLILVPPRTYAAENGREIKPIDIKFDLTKHGYGEITGTFYSTPQKPYTEANGRFLYSNMNKGDLAAISAEMVKSLDAGISKAEELFASPDAVQHVHIDNAYTSNGYFAQTTPHSIGANDETLKNGNMAFLTGFHESVHLLDYKYGVSDNLVEHFRGHQDAHHYALQEEHTYLGDLCESAFLPENTAGHAYSNPEEMLASFLNTFNHPNWEAKMSDFSTTQEFRYEYSETLKAVENAFLNSSTPKNAPIFETIREKESALRRIIGDVELASIEGQKAIAPASGNNSGSENKIEDAAQRHGAQNLPWE